MEAATAKRKPKRFTRKVTKFDLATADTTKLKKIYGIGSTLSARIVKFRDRLGGFHSMEQVKEVYGLKPEVAERLIKASYLGTKKVQQLPINQLDAQGLGKHPYVSYKLAKVLYYYREQHGPYRLPKDLDGIRMLSPEDRKRLIPYIDWSVEESQ